MKSRTIALLALSLAVLATVYYFDYRATLRREKAQVERGRLSRLDPTGVDRIEIRGRSGEFALEKRGREWWLARPRELRADATLVREKLLGALDQANKFSPFEVRPSQLADYGLDSVSALEIRLWISDSKEKPLKLRFGKTTPIQGECYLLDAAEPATVYIASAAVRDDFDQTLHGLRDKALFSFPAKRIAAFQVQTLHDAPPQAEGETTSTIASPRLTARRDAGGNWWVTDRGTTPLSGEAPGKEFLRGDDRGIEGILAALATMEAVDAPTSPGLSASSAPERGLVRLVFEYVKPPDDANPTTTTAQTAVTFAATKENDAPVLRAAPEGSDLAYKVERGLLTRLLGPVSSFRDPRVLRIGPEEAAYMQIQVMNTAFALERGTDGQWRFADDPDAPVNQVKTNAYLTFCLSLNVESFDLGPSPPDPKKIGLEPPVFSLMVRNRDGSIRERFEAGSRPQGDDERVFARRMRSDERNGASEAFLLGLPAKYDIALLKTRRFFAVTPLLSFEKDRIARIELVLRSEQDPPVTNTLTLERRASSGQAVWQGSLDEERPRAIPSRLADLLVSVLSDIEFQSDLEEGRNARPILQLYGLDNPYLSLRILGSAGEELARLQLGAPSPQISEKQASLPESQRSLLVATDKGYRYVSMDNLGALDRALLSVVAQFR